MYNIWLVVSNILYFPYFSIIYGIILPIDIYFSRWLKPPTRLLDADETRVSGNWQHYALMTSCNHTQWFSLSAGLFTRWSRSRPACCLPWGQLSKFPNPRSKAKLKTKPEQIWYQKQWVDQQKNGKHWGHAIYILYLVGVFFLHILGIIIPTDELIFFRGMNIVVTSHRSRRKFYGHWLGVTIPE